MDDTRRIPRPRLPRLPVGRGGPGGRPPGEPSPRVLVAADAVLALVALGAGYVIDLSSTYRWGGPDQPWLEIDWWVGPLLGAWCLATGAVFAVHRIRPGVATAALPALMLVHLALLQTGLAAAAGLYLAVSHLGRYAPPRWRMPALAAAVAGTVAAWWFRGGHLHSGDDPVAAAALLVPAVMGIALFWVLGSAGRFDDERLAAMRDRAELAAIAERTRIAREMHDIVAHSLTAVIAQADGGRYIAAKDPARAAEALETIAATARGSLAEMRGLLSVLRDEDSATGDAPMPGVDALPQLFGEARRSGLDVEVEETGTPEGSGPLGLTEQLTVYRIVQECLTNALRHAGHVPVRVELDWGARETTVRVVSGRRPGSAGSRDDGAGPGSRTAAGEGPRPGRGITGMRERVAAHGGSLDIDDSRDAFTVTARIPRR
ncbi:sensor histidine kinase [Corynebacterium sp. 335C]